MSSVDEFISAFFSEAGACIKRDQCDKLASDTFGAPIRPVPNQGRCSYTVAAAKDTLIVQFREPSSPLDIEMLQMVEEAHPGFVATFTFHRKIVSSPGLLVYSMPKLPGDNYSSVSLEISDDDLDHRLNTVRSLVRFFAQSWQHRSPLDPDTIPTISADCDSSLDYLSANLDYRFQAAIARVRSGLSALFSGKYPLVFTHGDLSEMNILADSATGNITRIIDWAETSIQPFGFALYVLDNTISYLTLKGWVFHDKAEYLREEFWKVFYCLVGEVSPSDMESIQLARLAGLFLRYGIPYTSERMGVVGIGGPNSSLIAILDALVLG